jgi:hypothetical protein
MFKRFSWYPQVGVSSNPFFTEADFDGAARKRTQYALHP